MIPSLPQDKLPISWLTWFLSVKDTANRSDKVLIPNIGDADFVLKQAGDITIIESTALTGVRTITNTVNNSAGDVIHVVRTAASTGASALSVLGVKNLAAGQWVKLTFDGASFIETAFGSL